MKEHVFAQIKKVLLLGVLSLAAFLLHMVSDRKHNTSPDASVAEHTIVSQAHAEHACVPVGFTSGSCCTSAT